MDLLPMLVLAYSLDAHTGIFPFVTRANTSTGIFDACQYWY
jgi:adenylosuccinate synthase